MAMYGLARASNRLRVSIREAKRVPFCLCRLKKLGGFRGAVGIDKFFPLVAKLFAQKNRRGADGKRPRKKIGVGSHGALHEKLP